MTYMKTSLFLYLVKRGKGSGVNTRKKNLRKKKGKEKSKLFHPCFTKDKKEDKIRLMSRDDI